jgi:IS1 family transposase
MVNVLPREKQVAIVSALIEGNSIRSTERMLNVHRDTITKLLVRVGDGCASLLNSRMINLDCARLEMDEIWSYVGKKQKTVRDSDNRERVGDQWVWVAIDADTKLIPSYVVGKRDEATCDVFVADVAARMRNRVQISTDGLRVYIQAIAQSFGDGVNYAQIVKSYEAEPIGAGRYSPPRVSATEKTPIFGAPMAELVSTRRRAPEPHHADGDAPLHAPHQRVQQEAGEPLRRDRAPRRALQLRSPAPHAAHHASDGGRHRRPHVVGRRIARRGALVKNRVGRPRIDEAAPKAKMFCIRLSSEERAFLEETAAAENMTASQWARATLLNAATKRRLSPRSTDT